MSRAALLAAALASLFASAACVPEQGLHTQADVPRHQRGIDVSGPFLAFHGRAAQMGDLTQVAQQYRLIAVDAEPGDQRFTREELATLRAGGRNIVLGFVNVGFCDRAQPYWNTAPDGLLPCVANQSAQIGPRASHPGQSWMSLDDDEYHKLILEYVAPRIEKAGVDGFLLDGLELLDHGPEDDEAACDSDCVAGGVQLLVSLRKAFPDMVMVMAGGLSQPVRDAIGAGRAPFLLDGVVGEGVYTPSYDAGREAGLLGWKGMGLKVNGHPMALLTQDYVTGCDDVAWARTVYQTSRGHGFSPSIAPSQAGRPRICHWGF
jgi:cysteinyl-tRNA synthetase